MRSLKIEITALSGNSGLSIDHPREFRAEITTTVYLDKKND